jgi:DNA-binding NarL/FixJ family response regulator
MSVLAVVPDLYFATRIAATAKASDVKLELIPAARAAARLLESDVSLVVLDLHADDALTLIGELKRAAPAVPVVGFYSHVETALRRDALAAGADSALPRSQFVQKLAALLTHGLAALAPGAPERFRL